MASISKQSDASKEIKRINMQMAKLRGTFGNDSPELVAYIQTLRRKGYEMKKVITKTSGGMLAPQIVNSKANQAKISTDDLNKAFKIAGAKTVGVIKNELKATLKKAAQKKGTKIPSGKINYMVNRRILKKNLVRKIVSEMEFIYNVAGDSEETHPALDALKDILNSITDDNIEMKEKEIKSAIKEVNKLLKDLKIQRGDIDADRVNEMLGIIKEAKAAKQANKKKSTKRKK